MPSVVSLSTNHFENCINHMKDLSSPPKIYIPMCLRMFSYHLAPYALWFCFTFCHKGGVICISVVIDIPHSILDSSLCFLQPSVSHDVLYMKVK